MGPRIYGAQNLWGPEIMGPRKPVISGPHNYGPQAPEKKAWLSHKTTHLAVCRCRCRPVGPNTAVRARLRKGQLYNETRSRGPLPWALMMNEPEAPGASNPARTAVLGPTSTGTGTGTRPVPVPVPVVELLALSQWIWNIRCCATRRSRSPISRGACWLLLEMRSRGTGKLQEAVFLNAIAIILIIVLYNAQRCVQYQLV